MPRCRPAFRPRLRGKQMTTIPFGTVRRPASAIRLPPAAGSASSGRTPRAASGPGLRRTRPGTRSPRGLSRKSRTCTPTTSHSRSRFVQEAEITGKLEHADIVPVYGLWAHDATGRPFYAMRFIQGDSLKGAIAAFHIDDPALTAGSPSAADRGCEELLGRFTRRLQRDRLCAQPRCAPSRPQARQHHARPLWRDARRRLGAGSNT